MLKIIVLIASVLVLGACGHSQHRYPHHGYHKYKHHSYHSHSYRSYSGYRSSFRGRR